MKEIRYRYFRLGGLPCGVCDQPGLWSEITPSGIVRTFHRDRERPPCNSLRASTANNQSKRAAPSTRTRPPTSAASRSSTVQGRRVA